MHIGPYVYTTSPSYSMIVITLYYRQEPNGFSGYSYYMYQYSASAYYQGTTVLNVSNVSASTMPELFPLVKSSVVTYYKGAQRAGAPPDDLSDLYGPIGDQFIGYYWQKSMHFEIARGDVY